MHDFHEEILLPAEDWVECTEAYSANLYEGLKSGKLCKVRLFEYRGYLYTVFGVYYGPQGDSISGRILAYRLLPEELFLGEKTEVYHDEKAIVEGRRERADHKGLIVLAKEKRMVCEKAICFRRGLPNTAPISISEAERHEQMQHGGWRALYWKGVRPSWKSLRQHPVALYEKPGRKNSVLLWKRGGRIEEIFLENHLELDEIAPPSLAQTANSHVEQLALF